jgi:hypothetical protein
MTFREALLIWQAWGVYRVQTVVYGVLGLLLLLDWGGATMKLGVVGGTLVAGLHASLAWGVWRALRWLGSQGALLARSGTIKRSR